MYKLIAFCLIAFYLPAHAQTQISGQIRTNTTWTKAGSPYICSGLIEVAPNITLTIEAGTEVILNKNMDIYGDLVIKVHITIG